MPKDSYYIKLDVNAYDDLKIKVLRKHHKWQGFGLYIFLCLKLRSESNYQFEYNEFTFEALAVDMECTAQEVQKFIDDCIRFKLFTKENGYFYSERLKRDALRLEEKREKTRAAGKASAEKRYGKTEEAKPSPGIAEMIKLCEDKTGRLMTPPELEILKDIADNYPMEDFEKALNLAAKKKSPMTYIARVLENWKQEKQPAKPARRTGDDSTEGMEVL